MTDRTWTVYVLGVLLIFLGVLAIGYGYVQYRVSPERIETQLERVLDRRVTIERSRLSFRGTLILRNVSIFRGPPEADEGSPDHESSGRYGSLDRLRLGFSWSDLLRGRVRIRTVEVRGHRWWIRRDEEGSVDLIDAVREGTGAESDRPDDDWEDIGPDRVILRDGRVQLTDATVGHEVSFRLERASVEFADDGSGGSVRFEGLGAERGSVSGEGRWRSDPFGVELQAFELDRLEVRPLVAYLPRNDAGDPWIERGELSGEFSRFSLDAERLEYAGAVRLENAEYGRSLDLALDGQSVEAGVEGSLERDTGRFLGRTDGLRVAGVPLTMDWSFSSLSPAEGRIRVGADDRSASRLVGVLPDDWTEDVEAVEGTVELALETVFKPADPPITTAELSFQNAGLRFDRSRRNWPDVSGLEGTMRYRDGAVQWVDTRMRVGDLGLGLEELTIGPPWDDPELEGRVQVDPAPLGDVRRLAEEMGWGNLPEDLTLSGRLEEGAVDITGTVLDPVYEGRFGVTGVDVDYPLLPENAQFDDMTVTLRPEEVELLPADGQMAGGALEVGGRLVRGEEEWSINFEAEARAVSVRRLMARMSDWMEASVPDVHLDGTLDRARFRVDGRLSDPSFRASLEGTDLTARLPEGELEQIDLDLLYEDNRLTIRHLTGGVPGTASSLDVRGGMAVPFAREQPMDLNLTTDDFPLSMVAPWLPEPFSGEVIEVGGLLDLEGVRLRGTPMNPRFDGRVSIRDGSVRYGPEEDPVEDIELEAVLEDRRIEVEEGTGQFDETPFRSDGELEVEDGVVFLREGTFRRPGWPAIRGIEGRVQFGEEGLNLRGLRFGVGNLGFTLEKLLVSPPWDDPGVEGRIRVESAPLEEVHRLVEEQDWVELPEELSISGTLEEGAVDLRGRLLDPEYEGTLRFNTVAADHPQFPGEAGFDRISVGVSESVVELDPVVGRMAGGEVRVSGRLVREAGSWRIESEAELTQAPVDRLLERYRARATNGFSSVELEGELGRGRLRVRGTLEEPDVTGDLEATGLSLREPGTQRSLENIELELEYNGDRVEIVRMNGRVGGTESRVRVSGEVGFPFDSSLPWSLRLDGEGIPVGFMGPWLPGSFSGKPVEYGGTVDLETVTVEGTPDDPRVGGRVRVRQGRVEYDPAVDPVEDIELLLALEDRRIVVEKGSGRLGEIPFRVDGDLRYEDGWRPDLSVRMKRTRASEMMAWATRLPEEEWPLEGDLDVDLRLTGGEEFGFSGTVQSPAIDWRGARFSQLAGDLGLTPEVMFFQSNRLRVFDGFAGGRVDFYRRENPRRFRVRAEMSEIELGEFLTWLTDEDHPSRGRMLGTMVVEAPLEEPYSWDGSTEVRARDLDFRGIRAFQELSFILNANLSRAVETGVLGFLRGLIRLNPREAMSRLRSLISDQATTRFDRGTIDVEWEAGRGDLEFLLRNEEVRLEGSGWIESDGQLDVTMRVVPRAPVLNRIERDWLRGGLSGGFPELRVTGSLQEPVFDTEGLRRGLLQLLPF